MSSAEVDSAVAAAAEAPPPEGKSRNKEQRTWYVSAAVVERVAAATSWARVFAVAASRKPGHDAGDIDLRTIPDTASSLVERALWAEVIRLEKLVNDGQPFPETDGKLKTGPGAAGMARLAQPRPRRAHAADDES